jgi:hypothetical protein
MAPMLYKNILVWNVRGLNDQGHRNVLRDLVASDRILLVCVQETNMVIIERYDVLSILGSCFDYSFLPADGVRGGILVAWRMDTWAALSFTNRVYSISLCLHELGSPNAWFLTSVYGPTEVGNKDAILQEIRDIQAGVSGPWLINGDFNMIYHTEDKNNSRLNRRQMGRFRHLLSDLELKELHLHGRLFTWSNEHTHPTLEHIDRVFFSAEWEDLYPNWYLQSLYPGARTMCHYCSSRMPCSTLRNASISSRSGFGTPDS